ncbi:E3 ubiquitin-protein ligase TRIM63 [Bagarius yarrelli]|uniref:E3 ubiquitin-protein ligase TRIM63 n=1 Tax=Bagarius yarrelli TaxID=175774 RepID=A0A556TTA3_BAGYA|nr:E3 ubiquitin-protein ligase TRIM63 [Bagarius yarrelli]
MDLKTATPGSNYTTSWLVYKEGGLLDQYIKKTFDKKRNPQKSFNRTEATREQKERTWIPKDMDIQTGQVVRAVGPMDSLEKQLSCPICLDMFTKPVVILPCQHNLCRGCANDLYDSRNPYHFSGGIFRCPTCRFEVVLDRHGVYGLQRNLLVENIIDIYKQQLENSGGGGGGDGLEPPLKAKETKEPMCQEHADERINIYCISCQIPTCSMCKVFGQHKDCKVSTLKSVYETQKTELQNSAELLAASNSYLQAMLVQMEETCKAVEENSQLQKQRLAEKFDLLYAVLEDRKGQLLEQITQEQNEKIAVVQSLVQQYKERLEASTKLIDQATKSLDNSSTAEFLINGKKLIAEARDTAKNSQLQRPEPGFENMDHLTLFTEEVEAMLAKIDFGADVEEAEEEEEEYEEAEEEDKE